MCLTLLVVIYTSPYTLQIVGYSYLVSINEMEVWKKMQLFTFTLKNRIIGMRFAFHQTQKECEIQSASCKRPF